MRQIRIRFERCALGDEGPWLVVGNSPNCDFTSEGVGTELQAVCNDCDFNANVVGGLLIQTRRLKLAANDGGTYRLELVPPSPLPAKTKK